MEVKLQYTHSHRPAGVGPGGDEQVVAEEEALSDRLPLPGLPRHAQPAPGTRPGLLGQNLDTGHNSQATRRVHATTWQQGRLK